MYITLNNEKIFIKKATSFNEKLIGLIGQKKITYGLLIPNCNHIHTFFMKDTIDVLFIDYRNCVLYKYENMPINRTFKVYEDTLNVHCLELPKNTTKSIRIGDVLSFESEHII